MLTLNYTHTHTHVNRICFSVTRVHIHSCATTLDKEGRLSSGVAAERRSEDKDQRVDGWLAEGQGSGGSADIHIHRAPDTMTNLERRVQKGIFTETCSQWNICD